MTAPERQDELGTYQLVQSIRFQSMDDVTALESASKVTENVSSLQTTRIEQSLYDVTDPEKPRLVKTVAS